MKFKLLLCLFFISPLAYCQFEVEGHLLENPNFLDATVDDYDVFLMAEMHFRPENTHIRKKMIEYLAEQNSIDVIVVERSFDFGYWVTHYLETGDSLLLKEFLTADDFFSTRNGVVVEDEYAFYTWLRQFNLDNNLSIEVVGIDLQAFWDDEPILWSFFKFIEQHPQLIEPLASSIQKAKKLQEQKNISTGNMLKWFGNLEADVLESNIQDTVFLNFVYNLKQSIPWARNNDINYRDAEIASNFLRYIAPGQKVFGTYGLTHVALKNGERIGWDTFASVLNGHERLAGKILSVGLICMGCDPDTKEDAGDFPGPDIFHHFLIQDDFNRLESAFRKLPHNTFVDLRDTDELFREYCQLLLVQYN